MKNTCALLTILLMSTALMACTGENNSSAPPTASTPSESAVHTDTNSQPQEPDATQQGETANTEQLKAATAVAQKYKETQYKVDDYTQLQLDYPEDQEITSETITNEDGSIHLPPAMQEQYDRLQPYCTEKALDREFMNRTLILPQQIAVTHKTNLNSANLELQADPVLKVNGILEIEYTMDIQQQSNDKNLSLAGTLQLQEINGELKIINDAYNKTDLSNLLNSIDRGHTAS